ncbi:hypothetical protein ACJX0J_000564 (mitochondrion) [Zea mays]
MTTEQADQEVVVLKIKISVKWQSSDSERKGMWIAFQHIGFLHFPCDSFPLSRFVNKSLKGPDLSLLLVTLAVINRVDSYMFGVFQLSLPYLPYFVHWQILTDWIEISLLIEYLDKQAQNKELRQLYQRWTNRISYSWKACSAFNNKTFALNCFSKDLHWANLNLFTSLLFETTPPNSFDNVFLFHSIRYRDARLGLTDLGWKLNLKISELTLWACKDKVDISSIGIERTWFMERIGGGHFHFNVAVGKYSFTKLEYDRVLFLALVNAQYLFNEEMNNRKSTILQIENVWCQRI